jgi:hypothetical protein
MTKFNSHRPFGWNDAGMRMVKGFQQSFSAGVFWKAGPLSIQLQPEYYQINAHRIIKQLLPMALIVLSRCQKHIGGSHLLE